MNGQDFVREVMRLAKENGLNCFVVTDGYSGTTNNGNPAVKNARKSHEQWELEHGFDPEECWS